PPYTFLVDIRVHALLLSIYMLSSFFFFHDTSTTEIYTLSLHDALPILVNRSGCSQRCQSWFLRFPVIDSADRELTGNVRIRSVLDRKSTRLNSSHVKISYAVFCLKKKKKNK